MKLTQCRINSCSKVTLAKGYCSKHYQRWYRYGNPHIIKKVKKYLGNCCVNNCDSQHYGKGYCQKHYQRFIKHGDCTIGGREFHGQYGTPTYKTWSSMLQRCNNPKSTGYKYYGGRGIKVCDRWLDFINFYENMGEKPMDLTIDRINNEGDYEPNNCRWVTYAENEQNRRDTVLDKEIVVKIKTMYNNGKTPREISDSLDRLYSLVYAVCTEITWRNIRAIN